MSSVYFCLVLQRLSAAPRVDLQKVSVLMAAQGRDPSTMLCLFPKHKSPTLRWLIFSRAEWGPIRNKVLFNDF